MNVGFLRTALVLGILSCIGPFAIDLYLPAMPQIASDLGTDIAGAQLTFTAYFVAFGVAQLIYGPLADWIGRKPPIYIGLGVFIAGSLVCMVSPNIGWLTVGRFTQALGAAAVMVIPRAIVRDLHTGVEATRLMSLVMLVISISPMLAPLTGSAILMVGEWHSIFLALIALAGVALLLTKTQLPETLHHHHREKINVRRLLSGCGNLLGNRRFVGLTLIGGFGLASFFVFIASASFVYMEHYGLTTTGFSLVFALNAIGFFGASQFAPGFGARFGLTKTALFGVCGFATAMLILLALVASGFDDLEVLMVMFFIGNACLGFVIAPTMVMALDDHGDNAGLASSLGGTLQMVSGGVMIFISGPFFDGTALPMVAAIALCATLSLIFALITLVPRGVTPLPLDGNE
ncbi:MAG: multidrug effflux MFS transporter [Rhodobacteraceae bacterium]|nr:multidrug effflux MFS transporter [Paracoccaceae bacterium]